MVNIVSLTDGVTEDTPVDTSLRDYLDKTHCGGKTHPKCEWCHSID